jgi:hypothetical protein
VYYTIQEMICNGTFVHAVRGNKNYISISTFHSITRKTGKECRERGEINVRKSYVINEETFR